MRAVPTPVLSADRIIERIEPGTNIIVPLANGEPTVLLDALQDAADDLRGVTVHQMHGLHDRPFLHGSHRDKLEYLAYFLSPVTRPAFHEGGCDLVPCHFSEMPLLLRQLEGPTVVFAAASPIDRHGCFSLGTNADYTAAFIGQVPFYLEANARMPRTFGRNQVHISQVAGWIESDRPLVAVPSPAPSTEDLRIAELVAERVPDRATIQVGIGSIADAIYEKLLDHQDLGLHTELMSDGVISLFESGVITGTHKVRRPTKMVATFALGTQALYDFMDENTAIELLPVDWVNDPRVIGQEPHFFSINATTEIDFLGQAASETIAGRYYSGSGGQTDFARGAQYSAGGEGFIVLPSTTSDGTKSRISAQLPLGSVVTTLKNTIDNVVTEYGVAELRGRSLRHRARALIDIAHPAFREELTFEARQLGYL